MITRKGKWKNLNINELERNKIYSRLRLKAYTILKKRHKKEYAKILDRLLFREYNNLNPIKR